AEEESCGWPASRPAGRGTQSVSCSSSISRTERSGKSSDWTLGGVSRVPQRGAETRETAPSGTGPGAAGLLIEATDGGSGTRAPLLLPERCAGYRGASCYRSAGVGRLSAIPRQPAGSCDECASGAEPEAGREPGAGQRKTDERRAEGF